MTSPIKPATPLPQSDSRAWRMSRDRRRPRWNEPMHLPEPSRMPSLEDIDRDTDDAYDDYRQQQLDDGEGWPLEWEAE